MLKSRALALATFLTICCSAPAWCIEITTSGNTITMVQPKENDTPQDVTVETPLVIEPAAKPVPAPVGKTATVIITLHPDGAAPIALHTSGGVTPGAINLSHLGVSLQPQRAAVPAIDSVKENINSKMVVRYRDIPVSVPVGKGKIAVINVPYPIKGFDTSKGCDEKLTKNCISNVGHSEYQVSLLPLIDDETDFGIITDEKTFVVTLVPNATHSATLVDIQDATGSPQRSMESEKSQSHPETMTALIRSVINGIEPQGFVARAASRSAETPDATFTLKREYAGIKFKVIVVDVINKTNAPIEVREDMKMVQYTVAKLGNGRLYAISAPSREFLLSRTKETEMTKEFQATLYAVVLNEEDSL